MATSMINLYIMSDSVGETAQYVAKAAARQFTTTKFSYKHIPFVDDKAYLTEVLKKVHPEDSILIYTMVVPEMREFIADYCHTHQIPSIDVLQGPLDVIMRMTDEKPLGSPGAANRMDASYYRKVEAIEFAIKSDDGKDAHSLHEADIVLIGVSRTSKTPLSMYLAYRGIKVANVPLVKEVKPPAELFELSRKKVIGLTIRPEVLQGIRSERMRDLGVVGHTDYNDLASILEEIEHAESLMKRIGCPVIDVSHMAIEETASTILQIYHSRGENVIE